MMINKYRVITDSYLGFEAQVKKWWFLFWMVMHYSDRITNTFRTEDQAWEFIRNKVKGLDRRVVSTKSEDEL